MQQVKQQGGISRMPGVARERLLDDDHDHRADEDNGDDDEHDDEEVNTISYPTQRIALFVCPEQPKQPKRAKIS